MRRSLSAVVELLLAYAALAAPAPEPFRSGWEKDVNPDRDCRFIRDKDGLTIELPGTDHDYDPLRERTNAPRILREVEGDFMMQVRVRIVRSPSDKSTVEEQLSSVSAGLLVIPPDTFRITCIRYETGVARDRHEESHVAWRDRDNAKCSNNYLSQRWYGNRAVASAMEWNYLRLERRGQAFHASVSLDGKKWYRQIADAGYVDLPAKLKVGLAAYSTSTEPSKVQFDQFKLIRGQKKER